jgi:hypothetical protein
MRVWKLRLAIWWIDWFIWGGCPTIWQGDFGFEGVVWEVVIVWEPFDTLGTQNT